jgi:hypothetical protein
VGVFSVNAAAAGARVAAFEGKQSRKSQQCLHNECKTSCAGSCHTDYASVVAML